MQNNGNKDIEGKGKEGEEPEGRGNKPETQDKEPEMQDNGNKDIEKKVKGRRNQKHIMRKTWTSRLKMGTKKQQERYPLRY